MASSETLPPLPTLLMQLQTAAELNSAISPDAKLSELGVDSLILVEWLSSLEADYGMTLPDEVLANLDDMPLSKLYAELVLVDGV